MEPGASRRVKEYGAHVTTAGDTTEKLGDGGRAVGRRPGSGEVVSVALFTSKEGKRAHEHRGNKKSSKRPPSRRGTDWSSVLT